jgi:hypothetical protein
VPEYISFQLFLEVEKKLSSFSFANFPSDPVELQGVTIPVISPSRKEVVLDRGERGG